MSVVHSMTMNHTAYEPTHLSVLDGSPATLIQEIGDGQAVFENEDGHQWIDPVDRWHLRYDRTAVVRGFDITSAKVASYLPANYEVIEPTVDGEVVIGGFDADGWTLDDYVLPRLASGLWFGTEVATSTALFEVVGEVEVEVEA